MSPEQLTQAIERHLGKRGGSEFCRMMKINRSTLFRWQAGKVAIPNWVQMVLAQWNDVANWQDRD